MEDVLEVYHRPIDQLRPLVCLDEFAKQLLSETRAPLAARPGSLAKYDFEYVREGSITGFMLAMPHLGKREVFISETGRRTSIDYAYCLDCFCPVAADIAVAHVVHQDEEHIGLLGGADEGCRQKCENSEKVVFHTLGWERSDALLAVAMVRMLWQCSAGRQEPRSSLVLGSGCF